MSTCNLNLFQKSAPNTTNPAPAGLPIEVEVVANCAPTITSSKPSLLKSPIPDTGVPKAVLGAPFSITPFP